LPWDSQATHRVAQTGGAGLAEAAPTPGGARMWDPAGEAWYPCMKVSKSVQFSALSVMMGNMGQGNYTAANIFLDKLPAFQRPEIDAVTLMWGAVGNIGMRWKAFASADMLNSTPDALLSIADATKVLMFACTKMETPEWYAASLFDMYTREAMLTLTAGSGSGGGWKPSEDAGVQPADWRADGLERGFLLREKGLDEERPRERRGAPLSGWPGLAEEEAAASASQLPRPRYDLELGARVQLVGLSSKNGTTGILVKSFADGKWKVSLEDGTGNALLKGCYLEVVTPAAGVAAPEAVGADAKAAAAAEARRAKVEERRSRLKERGAGRSQG